MEISKSKFIAYAFPSTNAEQAMNRIRELSDTKATHNCFAYKFGENNFRFTDDGEPSGK